MRSVGWGKRRRSRAGEVGIQAQAGVRLNAGLIFNIQRFSIHDGPGLRSTVFMKGCSLSCLWCHNPESRRPQEEFLRMESRCTGCGLCSEEELAGRGIRVLTDSDVDACPTGALQKAGERIEPAALVKQLLRDRIYFRRVRRGRDLFRRRAAPASAVPHRDPGTAARRRRSHHAGHQWVCSMGRS